MLNDILCMNKEISKTAFKRMISNWPIIFIGTGYGILVLVFSMLSSRLFIGPLAIISGFLMAFLMAAIYSHYLYLIEQIIKKGKINTYDLKDGFLYYIRKIYGVFFVLWIASFLLNTVRVGSLSIILTYAAILVFNALPETIYLKRYDSMESIRYSLDFIKENWVEWYIPNAVFLVAMLLLNLNIIAIPYSLIYSLSIKTIAFFIAGQIVFNYIMIYRGLLFELLSTSTRRKREFMRNCK